MFSVKKTYSKEDIYILRGVLQQNISSYSLNLCNSLLKLNDRIKNLIFCYIIHLTKTTNKFFCEKKQHNSTSNCNLDLTVKYSSNYNAYFINLFFTPSVLNESEISIFVKNKFKSYHFQ